MKIIYYPKRNLEPQPIIENQLNQLDFQLIVLPPQVNYLPTNYILYSDNIEQEDVKRVAYSLIMAGVEIKYIGPLNLKQKQLSLIEVGAENNFKGYSSLTVEEIETAKEFPLLKE
ncbi:MAG: hypothetical protein F6K10_10305 [Moorea sp. SIO2B7]|nr:hypothetical protein [Moorena sp. SIO2B7]